MKTTAITLALFALACFASPSQERDPLWNYGAVYVKSKAKQSHQQYISAMARDELKRLEVVTSKHRPKDDVGAPVLYVEFKTGVDDHGSWHSARSYVEEEVKVVRNGVSMRLVTWRSKWYTVRTHSPVMIESTIRRAVRTFAIAYGNAR